MANVPDLSEEQVVAFREQAQQAKFSSRRTKSVALAVFFGLACAPLLVFGFWTFAICALFVSLIGVSNYFAANGHLHRLQKRAQHHKRLARDFSKLEPDGPAGRGSRDPNRVRS
jgi:hypothetical protein